jgi:glycogen synthase
LRILIVGLGGVTRSFRNWPERVVARELVRRGHEVRAIGMIYPGIPGLTDKWDTIDGVAVRRVPQAHWPNRRLRAALEDGPRPDVIHLFHPRNLLAAQVTAWAQKHRIPTVFTWLGPYHDEYLVADRERPFDAPPCYDRIVWSRSQLVRRCLGVRSLRAARALLRNYRVHWPLRAAVHLVPCSQFEADEMRRMGLAQELTMVPLWIDTDAMAAEPEAPPAVQAPRPWILFVGQLSPRKGYDLALRAMPDVLRRHPTASLLLVSGINTADRERAEALAGELRIAPHVRFLGRVDDDALVSLFRSCDVYVTPTRYEGFGLTLLEAMASGVPVVATDVPAANELVRDGESGLLARPEDPKSVATAVLRILDEPELRQKLRESGRRTATDDFAGARLVVRLEGAYGRAIRGPVVQDEAAYFRNQVSKSDRKIRVQYGRMFRLAGLRSSLPEGPTLDVGCGAGPGLRYLASRGASAFGVDSSLYALKQVRTLVVPRGVAQANVRRTLPFRDGAFGLVVASEVIEHLPEGVPFLRECLRVLRREGVLLLTTPNLWDVRRLAKPLVGEQWSGHSDPTHINLYTPNRLARELREAGFRRPRVRTGLKPITWLPPYSRPTPIPYPPFIGNGIVATGKR